MLGDSFFSVYSQHLLNDMVHEGDMYSASLLSKPRERSVSLCLGFPEARTFPSIGEDWKAVPFHVEGRCTALCSVPGLATPLLTSACVRFTRKPCCCNTPYGVGKDNKLFFNRFPGYKFACIGIFFFFL